MKQLALFISMCLLASTAMTAQEPAKILILVGASSFVATLQNNATAHGIRSHQGTPCPVFTSFA